MMLSEFASKDDSTFNKDILTYCLPSYLHTFKPTYPPTYKFPRVISKLPINHGQWIAIYAGQNETNLYLPYLLPTAYHLKMRFDIPRYVKLARTGN